MKTILDPGGRPGRWRDVIAVAITNWVLNHIATPWYRDRFRALVLIGFSAVTREAEDAHQS